MTPQCGNSICCVGIVHVDGCAIHGGEKMPTIAEPHFPTLLDRKLAIQLHTKRNSVQTYVRKRFLGEGHHKNPGPAFTGEQPAGNIHMCTGHGVLSLWKSGGH